MTEDRPDTGDARHEPGAPGRPVHGSSAPAVLRRHVVAGGVLLALAVAASWLPSHELLLVARYYPFLVAFAVALAFPLRFAVPLFALLAIGIFAVNLASSLKLGLTELPLTSMDVRIAVQNPLSFTDAMNWPRTAVITSVLGLLAATAAVLYRTWAGAARRRARPALSLVLLTVLVGASVSTLAHVGERVYAAVKSTPNLYDQLWSGDGVATAASTLGGAAFLLMTTRVDAADSAPFFSIAAAPGAGASDPSVADPPAASRFLADIPSPPTLPNIVVMLLESTFDVGRTFDVAPPVKTALRTDYEGAVLSGAFEVNIVGGGSWVTEFETVVGVDTRLFGYSGRYTHLSLSPFVTRSIATYLREKGYAAAVLYPVPGDFYGAARAYARYGFERFLDSDHFALPYTYGLPDDELIEAYLRELPAGAERPLFVYASTIGNHGPHTCDSKKWSRMPFALVGASHPEMHCQLNEYVFRMKSTERAVELVEKRLREIERNSGRPYVLVLFGDHLPHTFVGTGSYPDAYDYSALRRESNLRTFYQIRSSARSPFRVQHLDVPAFLLPTLISAFAANAPTDLYLDANFGLLDACGARLPLALLGGLTGAEAKGAAPVSGPCANALARAVAQYRDTTWLNH